jgi:hypothetical protein
MKKYYPGYKATHGEYAALPSVRPVGCTVVPGARARLEAQVPPARAPAGCVVAPRARPPPPRVDLGELFAPEEYKRRHSLRMDLNSLLLASWPGPPLSSLHGTV